MPLTREEYLAVCQICTKRASSMQKGIICSLTNGHADYDADKCPDFELDPKSKVKVEQEKVRQKGGNKNSIYAGITFLTLGLIWLLGGLSFGLLFIWSFVPIIAGAVIWGKSSLKQTEYQKLQKKDNEGILDQQL